MTYPENLRYTKEHEWVLLEGGIGTVGITDHAQKELGDIVYVDLPKAGTLTEQGKTIGSVESVKAVSDIFSPISGEVVETNPLLHDSPEKLNADPFSGYLFIFRSRSGTAIRILQYDGQGFWLATKRLSKGRFRWWPTGTEPAQTLQAHQAQLLLAAGNPDTEAAPVWRKVS